MKVQFPKIKINGIVKDVYSTDLSGGGSSPSILRISFVSDSNNYLPNNLIQYDVSIGNFYIFTGHIVTCSERHSSAGDTVELSLIDTSIKLDNIFVGLKGKHGPPQAPLTINSPRASQVDLLKLSPTIVENSSTVTQISNLSVFETKGVFPSENFIFVGQAIDPCKDIGEDELDACDPCQSAIEGLIQKKLDCQKNRSFQILDVDYTFSDLISAAQLKGIYFNNAFASVLNYRAQYTGTLREVLNNWCQDFGYTFYWKDNTVNFVNLQTGLDINESIIESLFSTTCTVEDKSVSKSIEGNAKSINIAYFGKPGEIKEYDCTKSDSGGEVTSQPIRMKALSLELLMNDNNQLLSPSVYKSKDNFRKIIAAGNYSKELRDIFCWSSHYGYNNPENVKIGKHSLMGWHVKGVCHAATVDSQVDGYSAELCRSLYEVILTSSPDKGSFYSSENIKKLREAGAYFVIAEDFGTKAFDFERQVAENFCGKYWIHSTNYADAEVDHPDGQTTFVKGLFGNINYILPELNMSHPYIRSSQNKFLNRLVKDKDQTNNMVILLERPSLWMPDQNSNSIQTFLEVVNKCKIQEIDYSDSFAGLAQGDKLFLVYPFGTSDNSPTMTVSIENGATNPLENFEGIQSDLGITSRKTARIDFDLSAPNKKGTVESLKAFMPSEKTYRIKIRPNKSKYSAGPVLAIIPKLEIIVTEDNPIGNTNYVGVNVNYQNITDVEIGKLSRSNYRCYIDKSKVLTYADAIIKDLSNELPLIKKTIDYTILGIPSSPITFDNGLTNFSVRMDSGGTRTSLTFSNIFPVNKSDSVKRNELNYLINRSPIKTYLNNNL